MKKWVAYLLALSFVFTSILTPVSTVKASDNNDTYITNEEPEPETIENSADTSDIQVPEESVDENDKEESNSIQDSSTEESEKIEEIKDVDEVENTAPLSEENTQTEESKESCTVIMPIALHGNVEPHNYSGNVKENEKSRSITVNKGDTLQLKVNLDANQSVYELKSITNGTETDATVIEQNSIYEIVVEADTRIKLTVIANEPSRGSGAMRAARAAGIVYSGDVNYHGYKVGQFTVNGELAFCLQHEKWYPTTGTSFADQIYNNNEIRQILYGGWGGTAQWSGFESYTHGLVLTSLALSCKYYTTRYDDSDYIWTYGRLKDFMAYCAGLHIPDPSNLYLSNNNVEAVLNNDRTKQITQDITFHADSTNTITFSLQSGVTLHNKTTGATGTGNVTIHGNDTFYLSAPLQQTGNWSSGNVYGSMKKFQAVVSLPSTNTQDLGRGRYVTDPAHYVNLSVKWLDMGQIKVTKVDSETGDSQPQGGAATFAGTKYNVFKKDTYQIGDTVDSASYVTDITIGEDGTGTSTQIIFGDYIVIEDAASVPEGYLPDEKSYEVSLPSAEANPLLVNITSKEDVIRGDIDLMKYGEDWDDSNPEIKNPLANVEFTLTHTISGEQVVITTNKFGKGTTVDKAYPRGRLTYGIWRVEETKTPEGYKAIDPFEVEVKDEGQTYSFTLMNKVIRAAVQLVKKDIETDKIIKLPNTEFKIVDRDTGKDVEFTINYPTVQKITVLKTDENGQCILPSKLNYGHYQLVELKAPAGYLLDSTPVNFDVDAMYDWTQPLIIEQKDKVVKGNIELFKYEVGTETFAAGCVFEIIAAEDISTPDGTLRVTKGEVADVITTTSEGKVKSKDLYLGKYIVKERQQGDGYILDETEHEVELTYEDENTPIVISTVKAYNKIATLVLEKYRKLSTDKLGGVKFKFWNEKNPMDNLNGFYLTDAAGNLKIEYLKPDTTYCLQEVETLPGYVLDDTIHKIVTTKDGKVEGEELYTIKAENDWTKYDISKTDVTTGKDVPGCEMRLSVKNADNTTIIEEWTSDGTPHRVNMLVVGKTYVLEEIKACDGYLLANSIEFTIPNSGEVQKVEMKDEAAKGQIILNKFEDGTEEVIAHTEFNVYAAEDITTADGTVRAQNGELVDSLKTDENGVATSKELFLGKYTVKETKQVPGFALSEKEYPVELIYEDDKTPVVTTTEKIYNTATTLIIHKTQLDTDKDLSGVKFKIWAEQKTEEGIEPDVDAGATLQEEFVTDASGKIEIKYLLPDMTYCIQEIETLPGYVLDDTIHKVHVDEKGYIEGKAIFTYNIENDITKLSFSKKDLTTKEELAGAHVQVEEVQEDGTRKLIESWISNGKEHVIYNLEVGKTYAFKETIAPDGYEVAEEVIFTVKNTGEVQKIEMFDEYSPGTIRTRTPNGLNGGVRTGDASALPLYLFIAAGALAGILGIVVYKRKRGLAKDE